MNEDMMGYYQPMTKREYELIWNEYDRTLAMDDKEDDFIPSMERYNPMRFYRENHVFRIGHFGGRIIELNPKLELPTGSILHLADNFSYPEDQNSDTPRIEEHEFIERESFRKWIMHIKAPILNGPITVDDKFIYRPSGLPTKLMTFRSEYGAKFKYSNFIAELPTKKESLILINHNPLFRVIVFGRLRYYRRMNIILSSIFNTVEQMTSLGKQQFIVIPWSTEVFDKQLFIRSRKVLSPITIRRPDSFHYIFMMHLVNYMWLDAETSMFNKLSEDALRQLNIVLKCGTKYVFYNLWDIKSLNDKNKAYYRFVNQLNLLAVLGRSDVPDSKVQELVGSTIEVTESVASDGVVTAEVGREYKVKSDTPITAEEVDTKKDEATESVIAKIDNTISSVVKSVITPNRVVTHAIKEVPIVTPPATEVEHKKFVDNPIFNATASKKLSNEEHDQISEEYVSEIDAETYKFIDEQDHLTPKQKERYKKLSQTYKTLTIDGESLESLLLKPQDIDIHSADIDADLVGDIPDKSALSSSIMNFDKIYMKTTYKKQMAAILTSFQKNGVFIKNIKQDKTITEMNNWSHYSIQYEDINGKSSTIKFTLPVVDREGRVKVDGKRQVLKKQRINLPIVKISDTEVSLASNYNKTRVERNINKAHNFFSYIDSLVNSDKTHAKVEYGSGYPNLPISYEYCAIADRYNKITFDDWVLHFDFEKRKEYFEGKVEDMYTLEKTYGVFFGVNKTDHLFIDQENIVRAVSKYGGENTDFSYTSILEICKLSLNEGESFNKMLTEWVSIKILDKHLPVIFFLAFRFGLRNTLDHMGVPYVITEGRTKNIVSESVAGMASLRNPTPNSCKNHGAEVYGGDWIDTPTKEGSDEPYSGITEADSQDETDMVIVQRTIDSEPGLEALSDAKPITFPEEEIDQLSTQDEFYTTRVSEEYSKFQEGDVVITPWGKNYICVSRIELTDVKDHPFYKELTPDQVELIGQYNKIAVLQFKIVGDTTDLPSNVKKYTPKPGDIQIKFADRTLWINRYPLKHSLVVCGLDYFDTTAYELADFESKDIYYQLLVDKGMSTNYLKGFDSFFDLFIDPMTYVELKKMGEPTNVRDLLLRCAVLLSTLDHRPVSARANHRIRGYEQFMAILYNEMARQFAAYQSKRGAANTFSINPDAVYLRTIQNAAMVPTEAAGPMQDLKESTYLTVAGIGGRTAESFVVNDRKYIADDIGVVSEASVDNSKVAINSQMSLDPAIKDTTGTLEPADPDSLTPAQIFSSTALTMPFSTCDDSKRVS